MTRSATQHVTQILLRLREGDSKALDELMRRVYSELRRLAGSYLRRERPDHTLQTTALVHEAYLRMVDQTHTSWQNRAHFMGVAAQVMRHILVDHARARQAAKRGGGVLRVSLDPELSRTSELEAEVVALDDALKRLAVVDSKQSRIVELRYFAGLNTDETAEVLGVSVSTVRREWSMAKAWLYDELQRR